MSCLRTTHWEAKCTAADDTYLEKEQKMEESSKTGSRWYILLFKEKPRNNVFVDQLSCVFVKNALDLAYCSILLFYHLHFYMLFTEESPVFWGTLKKIRCKFCSLLAQQTHTKEMLKAWTQECENT